MQLHGASVLVDNARLPQYVYHVEQKKKKKKGKGMRSMRGSVNHDTIQTEKTRPSFGLDLFLRVAWTQGSEVFSVTGSLTRARAHVCVRACRLSSPPSRRRLGKMLVHSGCRSDRPMRLIDTLETGYCDPCMGHIEGMVDIHVVRQN